MQTLRSSQSTHNDTYIWRLRATYRTIMCREKNSLLSLVGEVNKALASDKRAPLGAKHRKSGLATRLAKSKQKKGDVVKAALNLDSSGHRHCYARRVVPVYLASYHGLPCTAYCVTSPLSLVGTERKRRIIVHHKAVDRAWSANEASCSVCTRANFS